jgi:hypothetical protein
MNDPFAALLTPLRERPGQTYTESLMPKPKAGEPRSLALYERRFMSALVKCGSLHGAADYIGITARTAEAYASDIRKKMGAKTTIHAVLAWDRAQRARP